jgi:hypothetical protein
VNDLSENRSKIKLSRNIMPAPSAVQRAKRMSGEMRMGSGKIMSVGCGVGGVDIFFASIRFYLKFTLNLFIYKVEIFALNLILTG